jgi:hypothetical protein
MPLEVPSTMWPVSKDQTLFTAWKSVFPDSAGARPEV